MSTLYIDRRNLSLSIERAALVIRENEQHLNTLPLKLIERLCIHGDLQLSAHSLGKLGEHGIGIVILSGRNRRPCLLMPNWKLDGKRRQRQYTQAQNPDFCLQQSRHICQEKLQAQLEHLHQYRQPPIYRHIKSITQHLSHISHSPSIAQIRGIEGAAAAQYFAAWQHIIARNLQFTGRNRRPPRDPVNSLLSLGYTLLHFETVKHLHLCGLDPYIGYYHQTEHGRESLACDLIEALRPQYDQWIIQHIKQQRYRAQDFRITANNCSINKTARQHFYQDYEQLAKQLRPQIHHRCRQLLKTLDPAHDRNSDHLHIIDKTNNSEATS